jgi:hypothetical protein
VATTLAAPLLAAGLAAGVVVAGAGPASSAPTTLTAANFHLQQTAYSGVIGQLDTLLPHASVGQVLDSANRATASCSAHAPALLASFCWRSDDEGSLDWYPQGITTSADATNDPNGLYQGRSAVLATWYWHAGGTEKGDRIAFVDYSNPAAPAYRFVLLVHPYTDSAGKPNFQPELDTDGTSLHAGGLLWYGHYLYVPDTWGGFRVFDLDHLWKVTTGDETKIGRQSDGTYQALNYAYALPEAFRFTASVAGGYAKERFSAVSLDRTSGGGESIVVPEYNTGTSDTHRVIRYPADPSTSLLGPAGSDGLVHATEAYETGLLNVQGAACVRGRFFTSASYTTSSAKYGTLGTFTRGAGPTQFVNTLQPYPEDLSYAAYDDALWSLSEHPGSRAVYAMRAGLLGWPTVSDGDTGIRVRTVQYLLNAARNAGLTVDGDFGAKTLTAVKGFQSANGLTADGVVGPGTWAKLVPALSAGATGDAVRALQDQLGITVSGTFDQATADAVTAFQKAHGLPVSGGADADTWKALIL